MTTPTPAASVSSVQAMGIASLQKQLTTRIQRMHIFRAPKDAPIPDDIAVLKGGAVELFELDEDDGWADMGLIGSDDAPTWARDTDTEDLMAIGFRDAVRTDMTGDVNNLSATFLERNRQVLETYDNLDMSALTPKAGTGTLRWVRPPDAPLIEARYAAYGQDGVGEDRVWMVNILTAGVLDSAEDQQWGGDAFTTFGVTLKGNVDTTIGTSLVKYMGGPGIKKQLTAMGFAAAA